MIILPVNVMLVKGHKTGHFQIFSGSLSDYVVRRFCIKQRSWERLETLNRRPYLDRKQNPLFVKGPKPHWRRDVVIFLNIHVGAGMSENWRD